LKKIILHPLKGIELENGQLLELGASKADVVNTLGEAYDEMDKKLFYDDLELRVDLDDSDRVAFIEFIYGPFPENVEIELYGINPFKTDSAALIEILTDKNKGEIDTTEEPYCYAFLESSIGVFRDSCEVEVEEMITEMKANGEYAQNEAWVLSDKEKARYFWTLGLGKKDYYKQ
jgi:hypothetical protein